MIRRLAFASLILAGVAGCDSLTTPESTTEEVNLLVLPQAGSPTSDSTLVTGDSLAYDVFQVTQTALIVPLSQRWSVIDTSRVRVVNENTGRFFVRRTGMDTIVVEAVVSTAVGNVTLVARRPIRVTDELFFGTLSPTTVRFLNVVMVTAPPEQRFGAGSQILFAPDPAVTTLPFIPGIVLTRSGDGTFTAIVPAGIIRSASPVAITAFQPDGRTLVSRQDATRAGGDTDLDAYEPNDADAAPISAPPFPFGDVMSIDTDADLDVYSFTLSAARTTTISLLWNVGSNLDFRLFRLDLLGRMSVLDGINDPTANTESATASLSAGDYELEVFAKTYVGPTTYILAIE